MVARRICQSPKCNIEFRRGGTKRIKEKSHTKLLIRVPKGTLSFLSCDCKLGFLLAAWGACNESLNCIRKFHVIQSPS